MSTGIIRRVDDLGRVAIPKDIRQRLGIEKGDQMKVYVGEDAVILRKFDADDTMK